MFIIWGARSTVKDFGPVIEYLCSNCNNKSYWKLIRTIRWFTIFFIPLVPFKVEYFIICPTCKYGIKLDEKKFKELKIIAENNIALANGTITQSQYVNNINSKSTPALTSNNNVNQSALINGNCKNCDTSNPENTKFCKNCGLRL